METEMYDIMDIIQKAYETGYYLPELPENLANDAWSCEDVCERCAGQYCPSYPASDWVSGYDDKGEPIIVNCPMCDYMR